MTVEVLMGRGVEGCGVTKNVVEFQKLMGVKVYATMDKVWPRQNSMEFDVNYFRGADWSEISKTTKKFPDLMTCTEVIDEINKCEALIVFSVPSKSHPEQCVDNFIELLKKINVNKSIVQVDHNIQSIHRNAKLKDVLQCLDVIMTHSTTNPFAKWCEKEGITVPITTAGVGYNFDENKEKYWQPIEEQEKIIRWVGRSAGWKGPQQLIDFHQEQMMHRGFITILEGLEASIGYKGILYKDDNDPSTRWNVVNKFRPEKEYGETGDFEYGAEEEMKGAYLYPGYQHHDMMLRMAKSMFGSDLYHLKPEQYGANIEYCHSDCLGAGTVPIFHEHFGAHIIHNKIGDPVISCLDSGTIFLTDDFKQRDYGAWAHRNKEGTDYNTVANILSEYAIDNVKRDEERHKAFEFWKSHCDAIDVYTDIINKTKNTLIVKKSSGLEEFFG